MRLTHTRVHSTLLVAGALFLVGCAQVPARPPTPTLGNDVAGVAKAMLGVPYKYGGATPSGFDCSGLAYYAYRRAGLAIPRDSSAQLRAARRVDLARAHAGDLLFFDTEWNRNHVGIYLGGRRFVHAPSKGKRVSIESLDDGYFLRRLIRVGRFGG